MPKTNEKNLNEESLFTEMRKLSPKVTGGIMRAREATYANGDVESKYKLLAAMAISIALRCEPCIRSYVKMAIDQGANKEEFVEFLNVAMTMQGCPGEEWALKAYGFYKEFTSGETHAVNDTCCPTH